MSILPQGNGEWQWTFSWEVLMIFEPRLLDLERTLFAAESLPADEFQNVFRLVRQRVAELVGWSSGRRDPVLRSSDAYHVVVAHMLAIVRRAAPQLIRTTEAEL